MSEPEGRPAGGAPTSSWIGLLIGFCIRNKLVVALAVLGLVVCGILVAPFDWDLGPLPRSPVPTDAIPDIGENQQIVFTKWMGRSPEDVEDQITYPLTTALLGISDVKTVRGISMFGFSSIYVIFQEKVDLDTSRNRILAKLSSLPSDALPAGVQPALGPEATALGQVFWYTLEGRGPDGKPAGGWDLQELRSIQDWTVRYGLLSARGIAEVASIGGFVKEYQVDVDPDAMRAHGVALKDVFNAVKMSNADVGARTIEVNRVEYVIRGLGFIKSVEDLEYAVVKVNENVPIHIKDVGRVTLGPALRRGALDKDGTEAVGGVVVVRYGFNPLEAIKNVKEKITELEPGLPRKVVVDYRSVTRDAVKAFALARGFEAYADGTLNQAEWFRRLTPMPPAQWPEWVTTSQVKIVPFYDRTGLIYETLGTLSKALTEEILVTMIVVLIMMMNLRSSLLVSAQLPLAVLVCFIAMRVFGVDANIVALSGIAIAIGTIVDMGIIVTENILKHLSAASPDDNRLEVIHRAASEVGGAVLTAVLTTVVGFLPVFLMFGAEGKLFRPLAFTKTFALAASVIIALTIVPAAAHAMFGWKSTTKWLSQALCGLLVVAGLAIAIWLLWWAGLAIALLGIWQLVAPAMPERIRRFGPWVINITAILVVGLWLTGHWLPLGPAKGFLQNGLFVLLVIGGLLLAFWLFQKVYAPLLRWCLAHKVLFVCVPGLLVLAGLAVWQGLGKEFMPPLDEGSFLYMPTTMTHASIGEALDVVSKQDMALRGIPEIDTVVGKIGRAETPLDPAPTSMIETVINYKSEYVVDSAGRPIRFRYDGSRSQFVRDADGELVPDRSGRPYRQWRDHIRSPRDIWDEIVAAAEIPGTTSAPVLQPISARLVMLQSGMRAPMGVKIKGPDLETIERVGLEFERLLKQVEGIEPTAVVADRIVGKPYIEIVPIQESLKRYGLNKQQVLDVIEIAIGGRQITTTVEGRERYPVRVRYMRELRDQIETLDRILVPAAGGAQIPLVQLADIRYVRGPQAIKSEDAFKIGYVLLDKKPGYAEVDVVENCQEFLTGKIKSGELQLPPGVSYKFAGTYESQIRSQKTLMVVVPVSLFAIFMILYFQFRSVATAWLVFLGIAVAWAGGFLLIWIYNLPPQVQVFGRTVSLDIELFGTSMRELFQVHPINLSVAIWVGFLALFGIASDNGVVMATYLDQTFAERRTATVREIREATVTAAMRRIRPCLMTSATTILALIPVLTSTGRGADIMVPMAIPSFGGMMVVLISVFLVPVLYCGVKEIKLTLQERRPRP